MGEKVLCKYCGSELEVEKCIQGDKDNTFKRFKCSNCGKFFYKQSYEIREDEDRISRKATSELGIRIRELENLVENWGEEDKKLKIIAGLLIEIGRKNF